MRQLKITKQITNRETPSLDRYLQEIGRVSLITAEEEVELSRRIQKGDQIALEKLTKANLRFVVSVAKQYQNQGMSLSDLINEGNLGLIKAAQRFDETRGFKFISYAVWWIRQSILQSIAEHARIVRLPLNKLGTINKVNRAFIELEQKYEREPSASEISKIVDFTEEEVKDSLKQKGRSVSMDAPMKASGDDDRSMYDVVTKNEKSMMPETQLMDQSLIDEVKRALHTVSQREADILRLYFAIGGGEPMTLEEIGESYGLTRERVRQIKEQALKKLKNTSRSKMLRKYLG